MKFISIKKRLPFSRSIVVALWSDGVAAVASYHEEEGFKALVPYYRGFWDHDEPAAVTHWCPLPVPPLVQKRKKDV
jgi:hypothetical protein